MNAYELADKLLAEVNCFDHQCAFDAATMLRQQADRIAELEKELTLVNAKLQFMFEQEIKSARINR